MQPTGRVTITFMDNTDIEVYFRDLKHWKKDETGVTLTYPPNDQGSHLVQFFPYTNVKAVAYVTNTKEYVEWNRSQIIAEEEARLRG